MLLKYYQHLSLIYLTVSHVWEIPTGTAIGSTVTCFYSLFLTVPDEETNRICKHKLRISYRWILNPWNWDGSFTPFFADTIQNAAVFGFNLQNIFIRVLDQNQCGKAFLLEGAVDLGPQTYHFLRQDSNKQELSS